MKAVFIFLAVITVANANSLSSPQKPGSIFPNSTFYQSLLERDAQQLTADPSFPADLTQQVLDVLATAKTGFEDCDSAEYVFPYMQRICIVQNYAAARNQLNAISEEAQSRAQSTTVTSAPV